MNGKDLAAILDGLGAFDWIGPGFDSNGARATLGAHIVFTAHVADIGPFQCLMLSWSDDLDGGWREHESVGRIIDPDDPDDAVDWMRDTITEWLPSARRRDRLHDLDDLLDGLSDDGITKAGDLYLLGDLIIQPLDGGVLAIYGRVAVFLPDRDGELDVEGLRRIVEDRQERSVR